MGLLEVELLLVEWVGVTVAGGRAVDAALGQCVGIVDSMLLVAVTVVVVVVNVGLEASSSGLL